jgi:hypothetical protein
MTDHAAVDSRFVALADAEPAVATGVLQVVAMGLLAGMLSVVVAAFAGFGLWGLILSYVVGGNLGVAALIGAKIAG